MDIAPGELAAIVTAVATPLLAGIGGLWLAAGRKDDAHAAALKAKDDAHAQEMRDERARSALAVSELQRSCAEERAVMREQELERDADNKRRLEKAITRMRGHEELCATNERVVDALRILGERLEARDD